MADRSVTVRLRADIDQFQREFAKASATAGALTKSLDGNDDGISRVGKSADGSGKQIDKLSGRLRLLLDALLLVGPAAIPISAVAVPALASLAAAGTIAAAAAGSVMVGFMGITKVMEAANKAALEPTADNLREYHDLMAKLPASTRDLVTELQSLRDVGHDLQEASADGFMPHAVDSLKELETLAPDVERLLFRMSDAAGAQAEKIAHGFTSDNGREFLDFLGAEARPTLDALTDIVMDLAGGLGDMWQAFDPVNDDALEWMVDATQTFRDWSAGLEDSQGFQEFVEYVRDNGPLVAETLGAIANMGIQIVQATAPLGGPVLQSLEAIADTVAAIADSPFGTPLIQGIAAVTLLNRGLSVTTGLLARMGVEGAAVGGRQGIANSITALGTGAGGVRTNIQGLTSDVRAMRGEYERMRPAGAVMTSMLSNTTGAATRTRAAVGSMVKGIGKAGAAGAALAVLTTDAGQNLGLTNTAMGAMVGMVAGPWGAAAGSAVGLALDFASAAGKAEDAQGGWNQTLEDNQTNFAAYNGILKDAQAQYGAYRDDIMSSNVGEYLANTLDPDVWVNFAQEAFGVTPEIEQMENALQELEAQQDRNRAAAQAIGQAFGEDIPTSDVEGLQKILERAQPAMEALGYSFDDLANADPAELRLFTDTIANYTRYADSAEGRTDAFAQSVADLANDALSTADSATQMSDALEALLGPELNAEEATDAWRESLKKLQDELKSKAGFEGFTKGAMENRALTRDYTESAMERLKALAGVSTTTERDMANAVRQTRREFIQSGIAAGFSRKEITRRADALGLTPKLVRTVFQAAGITQADLRARQLRQVYRGLPKRVQTDIRANGIPETGKDVDRLVEKYHLTEKQRTALVTLKDLASQPIGNVLQKLGIVDRYHASPSVVLDGVSNVIGAIANIGNAITNLDGRTATTTVFTRHVGSAKSPASNAAGGLYANGLRTFAGGGYGANGRYYPREPRMVAGGADILWGEKSTGWEAYISGDPKHRDRNLAILDQAARRLDVGGRHMTSMHAPAAPTHRFERVVEKLPDTIVLDAGELGEVVIDTLDGRIDDHREHDARRADTVWTGVTSD